MPLTEATAADIQEVSRQLGRPARDIVAIAARCVCGNPVVVQTKPRLADGTPFPTVYYLTHPAATAAVSTLEATGMMVDLQNRLAEDADFAAAYRRAHEAYIADRDRVASELGMKPVDEIAGISAGGMPTRVKCLHALVGHALAAGPGVNLVGDLALEACSWSPSKCACAVTKPLLTSNIKPMPAISTGAVAPKILIVGGGYAGFYTAKKLEKYLGKNEAEVTIVDPLPYMTYQPFLPEVAAGSIEARHAVVSLRRHLRKTNVITGKVTFVNHAKKQATIEVDGLKPYTLDYDHIVVTAGAVSRTFPIPGVADVAIGLKNIEEAVEVRNRILGNFDKAANLPAGPARDRLLTFVVVGGGFAGIEAFAETRSLASYLLRYYPTLSFDDVHFHLIEAMGRIMPEVSQPTSEWVIANLDRRGAKIHLNTQLLSAEGGKVELSTGEKFESDLIIWTAGVMANPVVRNTDLPLDERGRVTAKATLQVVDGDRVIEGAWTAGDVSAVPDLSGFGVGGYCVPNAQHAVRQGKLLAKNLLGALRGGAVVEYFHKPLGAVAGLGIGVGVYQWKGLAVKGLLAWFMHRGYHGLAIPMWERKIRVFAGWIWNFLLRRDIVSISATQDPRLSFETWASRPKK